MTLKVAIAQAAAAAGTPTYTQDFTDSSAGFSSDVKAAIFIGSKATANHTSTATAQLNIGIAGATGGTTYASAGSASADGAGSLGSPTTTDSNSRNDSAYAYSHPVAGNGGSQGEFTVTSWLSTGVQVSWTDQSEDLELISTILLGGDIEARVVSAALNGTTPVSFSHGLSGAPEIIIGITSTSSDGGGSGIGRLSLGFWDGANYAAYTLVSGNGATAENLGCYLSTSSILSQATAGGATDWQATLQNINSSTFEAVADAATTDFVAFLCIRGSGQALAVSAGVFDTSTSTGVATEVSGLSAAASVLLCIPTMQTATGLDASGDMNQGLIAAVNNSGAGTQYGGVVNSLDDNANPTVNKCQSTNSQALRILDATGTADVEATIDSWGTSVALNYSNVNANAFKVPYLAFGQAVAGGSIQFFQYDWPHQRHARL